MSEEKYKVTFSCINSVSGKEDRTSRKSHKESILAQVEGLRKLAKLPKEDTNRIWDIVIEKTVITWEIVDGEETSVQ